MAVSYYVIISWKRGVKGARGRDRVVKGLVIHCKNLDKGIRSEVKSKLKLISMFLDDYVELKLYARR